MNNFIREMSSRTKNRIFAALFAVSVIVAVAPPAYLASSGVGASIAGLPFAVLYWILGAVLITGTVWALWYVEGVRGEQGYEEPAERSGR